MSNMSAQSIDYSCLTAGMLVVMRLSSQSEIKALVMSVNKKAEQMTFMLWFSNGDRWDNYALPFCSIKTCAFTLLSDCCAKST